MNQFHIMNLLATEDQLRVLKRNNIFPPLSEERCELITKTNAERLIASLKSEEASPLPDQIRKQHRHIRVKSK